MRLPTLYKRTSTGAIEQWTIEVKPGAYPDYLIVTEYGHVGGKLQQAVERVTEGKNLGKKNETTVEAQAISQAQSEWGTKLTRKGYVEDMAKAEAGENAGAGGIRPMLAKTFDDDKKKLKYPVFAQPKLDGIRCIATIVEGKATLWSRTRKPIKSVPHIVAKLEQVFAGKTITIDGELYNADYKDNFEQIVSLVRQEEPAEGHEVIQYHIYDIADPKLSFEDRNTQIFFDLKQVSGKPDDHLPLCYVDTKEVTSEEGVLFMAKQFMNDGYEGAMVRNQDRKSVV